MCGLFGLTIGMNCVELGHLVVCGSYRRQAVPGRNDDDALRSGQDRGDSLLVFGKILCPDDADQVGPTLQGDLLSLSGQFMSCHSPHPSFPVDI